MMHSAKIAELCDAKKYREAWHEAADFWWGSPRKRNYVLMRMLEDLLKGKQ
jgi:hypothetical protein